MKGAFGNEGALPLFGATTRKDFPASNRRYPLLDLDYAIGVVVANADR
jgi:hypothetical protein